MFTGMKVFPIAVVILAGTGVVQPISVYAQDAAWQIGKSWGGVLIGAHIVQGNQSVEPGDSLRTGQNSGAVLVQGQQSIAISSKTEITISKDSVDATSTTITQRTGSIAIAVGTDDNAQFEVITPLFTAVANGSKFQVAMDGEHGRVRTLKGEVEVTDVRTGQRSRIAAGQSADISAHTNAGISLGCTTEFVEMGHGATTLSRLDFPNTSSMTSVSTARTLTSLPEPTHAAGQESSAAPVNGQEQSARPEAFAASPTSSPGAHGTKDARKEAAPEQTGDTTDAKGPIDKVATASGTLFDSRQTKEVIETFGSITGQASDVADTRTAISHFLAPTTNNASAQNLQPEGSGDKNDSPVVARDNYLPSWSIPIGIGIAVAFAAKAFGRKRQPDSRPLDYYY